VPPDRAAGLLDALDHLEGSAAIASRAALDDLARQFSSGEEPLRVTGPPAVLRELLLVAIDEAGEALGARCTGLLRGEASSTDVRAGVAALGGLLELLDEVSRVPRPAGESS
jgi:hypothetical protein